MIKNLTKWMQGKGRPAPLPTPADLDAAFARQDFAAAIALTRQLADEGNAAALYRLGEVFEHGLGVLQDFGQALEWYEKAAEAGFENAWAKLGDFYLAGRGTRSGEGADADKAGAHRLLDMLSVQPDHAKALHWNRKAAQAGQATAQAHLALQYIYGLGIETDRDEAERLFLSAAEQGSVLAQRCLGMLYAGGEDKAAQYDLAERWFRAASEGGDAAACMALAMLIINGHAGSGTDEDAYHLLGKAADEGNVEAMLYLGSLYRDGRGTAQDLSVAETWFRRASVRGNRNATLSLGFLLTEMIEPRDYVSGASIFREAAEQGDPVGQYVLGKLYLAGLGVPQDDEKAYGWLAQAAEQELMQAIETLAALTAGGRGVEANTSAAIRLFERAAEAGSIDAPYHKAMLMMGQTQPGAADDAAIIALLKESASRGSAAACIQLGVLCASGERLAQDYDKAARFYASAAKLGSVDGLFNLAFLRLQGLDPNPADARGGIALLEEEAAQGHGPALWALHNIYREGRYTAADPMKADFWLAEAARQGSAAAATRLAERLDEDGQGALPADVTTADVLAWLEQAALRGDTGAQVRMGLLYAGGRYVPQDDETAFRWMHGAAEAGHVFAQAWMGDVLFRGQGVIRDEALAMQWYAHAAAQGHEGARAALGSTAQ